MDLANTLISKKLDVKIEHYASRKWFRIGVFYLIFIMSLLILGLFLGIRVYNSDEYFRGIQFIVKNKVVEKKLGKLYACYNRAFRDGYSGSNDFIRGVYKRTISYTVEGELGVGKVEIEIRRKKGNNGDVISFKRAELFIGNRTFDLLRETGDDQEQEW